MTDTREIVDVSDVYSYYFFYVGGTFKMHVAQCLSETSLVPTQDQSA